MNPYSKLLLSIDLAHDNHEVIERGVAISRESGAGLILIYVLEPLPPDIVAGPFPLGVPSMVGDPDLERTRLEHAEKALAAYAESHGASAAQIQVRSGPTTDVILDAARVHEVDLILVGSHGRSGLSRLLGSSASAIVHQAGCDVLTVRVSD